MDGRPPATFNFADVWEMAADAVGDRSALVVRRPQRRTYAAARGARQPPGQPPARPRASGPATTSASTSRTAPSTSRRCWPASRSGPSRSTSTTATSPASCATCSTTATPSACSTARSTPTCWPSVLPEPARGAVDARRRATEYDAALAAALARRARRAATAAATTTTSSTRAAPRACRRASCGARRTPSSRASAAATRCACSGEVTSPGRAARADRRRRSPTSPLAPLMHAAAQWTSFMWFFAGGKVVLMEGSLDPEAVWRTRRGRGASTSSRSSATRWPSRCSTRGTPYPGALGRVERSSPSRTAARRCRRAARRGSSTASRT